MTAEIVSQIVERYNNLVDKLHVEQINDSHESFIFGQLNSLQYVLFLADVKYYEDDEDYIWIKD